MDFSKYFSNILQQRGEDRNMQGDLSGFSYLERLGAVLALCPRALQSSVKQRGILPVPRQGWLHQFLCGAGGAVQCQPSVRLESSVSPVSGWSLVSAQCQAGV